MNKHIISKQAIGRVICYLDILVCEGFKVMNQVFFLSFFVHLLLIFVEIVVYLK